MKLSILVILLLAVSCSSKPDSDPISRKGFFTDITEQSKIQFIREPAPEGDYFFPEINGFGGGFIDYDRDGDLDIYLLNGEYRKKQTNQQPKSRLLRQESNGTFTDVTDASGLGNPGYAIGVAAGDIDNDGDADLYVANFGPDKLYRNDGNGKFTDITKSAGISDDHWSTAVAFFDYDRDGFLDIYVATYIQWDSNVICTDKAGRKDYCGPAGYDGVPDILFKNNGDGTFTDVSTQSSIGAIRNKGLGVVTADFNGDHHQDIYVANDQEPSQLFMNQGDGTFRDMGFPMGAAVNAMGQPEANMGVAIGDADNDGFLDLFVTHLRNESNTFYRGTKMGFQDDTTVSGLGGPSIPYTGFGTGFFDYDQDGDLDIAVVNGRVIRGQPLTRSSPPAYWDDYAEPHQLFENNGGGSFTDSSSRAGSFTSHMETGRGLAFGDVDNDGDLDLLVTSCGAPARLHRNDTPDQGNWLQLSILNPEANRDEIGARVIVTAGEKRWVRLVNPHYSYLSTNDHRVHFGLGAASSYDKVEVQWLDGQIETFPGGQANKFVTIHKGKGSS
jgi:hypothetical protein